MIGLLRNGLCLAFSLAFLAPAWSVGEPPWIIPPPRPELQRMAFADRLPALVALRCHNPPQIDGKLDEELWARAPSAGSFWSTGAQPKLADAWTRVRLAWDDEALYLSATLCAYYPQSLFYWDPEAERSFDGQALELLLDPEHGHRYYLSVTLNADGTTSASRRLSPGLAPPDWAPELIECAVAQSKYTLTLEAKLPWEALGLSPPEGACWAANFIRRGVTYGDDPTMWAPTFSAAEVKPERFGDLWFVQPRLSISGLRWDEHMLGANTLRLWAQASAPLRVTAVVVHETPFARPVRSETPLLLGPQRKLYEIPYVIRQPGHGTLRLELLGESGEVLYRSSYPINAAAVARLPGLGEFDFRIPHRVYGCGEPVRVEFSARRFERDLAVRFPLTWRLLLLDGRGEILAQAPALSVDEVRLRCLRLCAEFSLPADERGEFVVRAEARDATGRLIAQADHVLACDPETMDRLGMAWLWRFCRSLREGTANVGIRARYIEPTLAYRIQAAWRKLEQAPYRADELGQSFWDAWRELDPAWRMAQRVLAFRSPFYRASGTFLCAYRSSVDDSLQPFGLYVPPWEPPEEPAQEPQPGEALEAALAPPWPYSWAEGFPVLLALHGWDGANRGFRFPTGPHAYKSEAAKYRWLVVWPFGRGNQDWRDSAETDLFEVLDTLDHLLGINRRRIYLSGVSMGGRGTWHLAMRRPSMWAAALPIAGAAMGSVWGVWNEERLTPNLMNLPMFVVHGAWDAVVPVEDDRRLVESLRELGYDCTYREEDGGHSGFPELAPTYFSWLNEHVLNPYPARVHFETDSLRWSTAYWVSIEGIEQEEQLAKIDAAVAEGNWVYVTCEKVLRFALRLGEHPEIDATRPVQVVVNAQPVYVGELPQSGALCFVLAGGRWRVADAALPADDPPLAKRPGVQGPMRDATFSRFLFVYGTQGDDPEKVSANFYMAKQAADTWRRWWWGEPRLKADVELSPQDIREANLLLYGGPESNAFCAKIAAKLPLLSGKPIPTLAAPPRGKLAFKFIYPNPLNPKRYVLIFAGPTPLSQLAIGNAGEVTPWPVPLGMFDTDFALAEVNDWDVMRPILEGSFDATWRWPPAPKELLFATGPHWKTWDEEEPGWQSVDFDDGHWRQVYTRFRKELDDSCWVPYTLRNFRRLRPQFLPPVQVIWHPAPSDGWARYFRGTFWLAKLPAKASGRLWLKDYGALYINGREVYLGYESQGIYDLDLTDYLRLGKNVVAIRAGATEGERGILFQCVAEEPSAEQASP